MVLKQIYAGVVTVILEATKRKLDTAQLKYFLTHREKERFPLFSTNVMIHTLSL